MLDRELIDELWKNDPEMQQLAQQYDERPTNRILSRKINEFDNSIPHNVAQRQFDMIRQIADSGESVIFVGRCADYILKDRPDCLHIFIHADMEHRAARVRERYGETSKPMEKRLQEKDSKRKVYYKHYTNRNWGEAGNYDVCLDSGALGVDKCVDFICDIAEM